MNKIYKVIRNDNDEFVATSELGRSKSKTKKVIALAAAGLMSASAAPALADAASPGFTSSSAVRGCSGYGAANHVRACQGLAASVAVTMNERHGSYQVQYISLSDATQAQLNSISTLKNQVDTLQNQVGSLGLQNTLDGAVFYDDANAKTKVTFNSGGPATTLSNVADGTANTDAVNKGQLNVVDTKATNAATAAAAAQSTANTARTEAAAAQTTANNARTIAQTAQTAAAAADAKAVAAQNTADKAYGEATRAYHLAEDAKSTANVARTAAAAADAKAVTAQKTADANKTRIDNVERHFVAYDSYNGGDNNTVTFRQNTKLTNISEGESRFDAVNFGQLEAVKNISELGAKIAINSGDSVVNVLGGNATRNVDGKITMSNIGGTNQNTVHNAISNVNTKATQAQTIAESAKENTDRLGQSVANTLGGGTVYDSATGQITDTVYIIGGNNHNNVGDALTALDVNVTQNTNNITQLVNGEIGLVQTDGKTITVGKKDTASVIDFRTSGNAAGVRKLTGLADGAVRYSSTDAVNGSQLYRSMLSVAQSLGAGSVVNTDGSISSPSYVVNNTQYTDVGGAINAIDNSMKNLDGKVVQNTANITKLIHGEIGLVQTDGNKITIDKDGTAKTVDISGSQGPRTLTGVADATKQSDAVNLGQFERVVNTIGRSVNTQLDRVENNLDGLKHRVDNLSDRVDENRKIAARGIASALALQVDMPAQHPGSFGIGANIGHYDGATAIGVGANYLTASGKVKFSFGVGSALSGKARPAARAGFGMVF